MIVLHEYLEVKNNTVINAGIIVWAAAVQHSVSDKDNVSRMVASGIAVKSKMKSAGYNPKDFIVMVPVIGHVIPGTVIVFVIKSNRKIKSPLLPMLSVIKIFHRWCSYIPRDIKQVNILLLFYSISLLFRFVILYNKNNKCANRFVTY